jgi:hypothetical protein
MDKPEIVRYCDLMEEIKRRIAVVDQLGTATGLVLPPQVRMESIYLQYRKILELIAFGSLVSNRDKFSKVYARFSKYWNAADLLRDLERVNRDFYPKPKLEELSPDPQVKRHLVDKPNGYLTKGQFLELYGRAGDILHERNPYAGPSELEWFLKNAESWRDRIIGLLNTHVIHLVGMPSFYLVHMQGEDGKVHHYTFMPVDHAAASAS